MKPNERNEVLISHWRSWGAWRNAGGYSLQPPMPESVARCGGVANPVLAWAIAADGSDMDVRTDRCYQALDVACQAIARGRYMLGLSWPDIAEPAGIDLRGAEALHQQILDRLDRHLRAPFIVQGDDVPTFCMRRRRPRPTAKLVVQDDLTIALGPRAPRPILSIRRATFCEEESSR